MKVEREYMGDLSKAKKTYDGKRTDGLLTQRIVKPVSRSNRVGRNEPCSCGSQIKFKKCCGT